MTNWKQQWEFDFNEANLAEEIAQAEEVHHWAEATGPCVQSVTYNTERDLIELKLTNNAIFAFPPSLAQGLENATPEQLNDVWIDASGLSVHWDSLNADFSVRQLIQGIFGSKQWMSELQAPRQQELVLNPAPH